MLSPWQLLTSFDIYSLCSDIFLKSLYSVIFCDLNTYIETWNLGKYYQCFKTSFMISLGWTQACKGKSCRFYGIRCHGNEINTCDFPERKF